MKKYILDLLIVLFVAYIFSLFYAIPFIALAALIYSIVQVFRLLNSLGRKLPFKELIVSISGIQLLAAPYLEYYYFQFGIYGGMNVDPMTFYSYAFPCVLFLHLGLELFYPRNNFESRLFEILPIKQREIETRGILLIIIGYGAYLFTKILPSLGPLDFVFHLVAFSRFIGFLYIWFSGSKYTGPAFLIVTVPFAIEAINETIFIQLIVYFTILMTIYYMRHQTSKFKIYLIFIISAMALILVQSVKYGYRTLASEDEFKGSKTVLFTQIIVDQIKNYNSEEVKLLLGNVNVRVNQGWILADIINNLGDSPKKIKPEYFKKEIFGIILPRFLFPDKPIVGDHDKFYEYTGWRLSKRVAMSVGLLGDGYGNFGPYGGMIYCLGFGILLGLIFKLWNRWAHNYPTLILWGVMIFFYCMRAGDETYIIINWIVKSGFFVLVYFLVFETNNKIWKYSFTRKLELA